MTAKKKCTEARFRITHGYAFRDARAHMEFEPLTFRFNGARKLTGVGDHFAIRGDTQHGTHLALLLRLSKPMRIRLFRDRVVNLVWIHFANDGHASYWTEASELDLIEFEH